MSTNNSKSNPSKTNNKVYKLSKKETQGNILIFYVLQQAASLVLDSKITTSKIQFKTPVKAIGQYSYSSEKEQISDEQKSQIIQKMNDMFNSNINVSCSKFEQEQKNNDYKIPKGINIKQQLFQIKIGDIIGISHIPITVQSLNSFNNFKMVKEPSYKTNKNILEIFYSFEMSKNNNKNEDDIKSNIEINETDDRMIFAKEIIELVINDLNVKNINKQNKDKLLGKVHDVLNQFQSISYTKGYKAATFKH